MGPSRRLKPLAVECKNSGRLDVRHSDIEHRDAMDWDFGQEIAQEMTDSQSAFVSGGKRQKYLGNRGLIALIAFLSAFVPLSTDLYLPALPGMSKYFQVSAEQVNLTLIFFFIVFAAGMLFWGPLSDKYGPAPHSDSWPCHLFSGRIPLRHLPGYQSAHRLSHPPGYWRKLSLGSGHGHDQGCVRQPQPGDDPGLGLLHGPHITHGGTSLRSAPFRVHILERGVCGPGSHRAYRFLW